ncbi:MAG: helix-turn-helix transcriptional regulator [Candidatus Aminicenantes bacterium]|jgi:DNA-binding PadR family transcriptional regulator
MRVLTLNEEIILIAVCHLGGSAYGVAIRDKVTELTDKEIVYGTLYNSLEYLIRKGFVRSAKGDPTPERGGKRKTTYSITLDGKKALMNTRSLHEKLWKGMPDLMMDLPGKSE